MVSMLFEHESQIVEVKVISSQIRLVTLFKEISAKITKFWSNGIDIFQYWKIFLHFSNFKVLEIIFEQIRLKASLRKI